MITLHSTITYWAPNAVNSYGENSYAPPITMKGRWEDVETKFVSADGMEVNSNARVILSQEVEVGGMLYLGDSSATVPPAGAREVKNFKKTPNIRQTVYEYLAQL